MLSVSMIAVVGHELGHLLFMKLLRVNPHSVEFSVASVKITTGEISDTKKDMFISLSGPLINLFLSFFLFSHNEVLTYFGAANSVLFVFNMFPIKGLDGGDVLYYWLHYLKFRNTDKLYSIISYTATGCLITAGAVLFYVTKQNITLMLVGIYLLILSFYKI